MSEPRGGAVASTLRPGHVGRALLGIDPCQKSRSRIPSRLDRGALDQFQMASLLKSTWTWELSRQGVRTISRLAVNFAATIGTTVITPRILAADGSRWQFLTRASLYSRRVGRSPNTIWNGDPRASRVVIHRAEIGVTIGTTSQPRPLHQRHVARSYSVMDDATTFVAEMCRKWRVQCRIAERLYNNIRGFAEKRNAPIALSA
jgi:hypothetical protein